ncbi:radical SAM protein [Anaerosinus massiliensis]|uniref:radical SAM protein n=1 Tax=Massilibacillus massiliensis TaxID=1806837 RepID=UPI000AA6E97B|nr:radical SAM protein [Massilibacillus massiliensis]
MAGIICFSYPNQTKSVSVTAQECAQDCAHCGGHYLKQMLPISAIEASDAKSFLISGGCEAGGRVPIGAHMKELKAAKKGRRYNLHVGLINQKEIDQIAEIADFVSFDFVGDQETIREVFGLQKNVEDYMHCYQALRQKVNVMPHICIGLHGGEIKGEYKALELLQKLGMDGLTFIIFTPTRGTQYADRLPPKMEEVVKLLKWARRTCPEIPIHLGCMRPGGRYRNEIDQWAVKIGLDTIVNPTPKAVELAKTLGLTIHRSEECCVL